MEVKKHNGSIALWKFIFSLMILALHFGTQINSSLIEIGNVKFEGGSIVVDFFFIVSGYLIYAKAKKNKNEIEDIGLTTKEYVKKRFLPLLPFVVVPYIINLVMMIVDGKNANQIISSIFYLTMLTPKTTGIQYFYPDGVTWYLGVLLIWSAILYPILLKDKKHIFIYIICPIIVILLGGYLSYQWKGSLGMDEIHFNKQLLRGLLDINIGLLAYEFANKRLSNINFNKFGRLVLNLIEIIGFVSIFFIVNTKNSHKNYDYIMLGIFFICVSIAFSNKTYTGKMLSNKFVFYLERLSLPIYLSHLTVISIINRIIKANCISMNFYCLLTITIIATIIVSILELQLIKSLPFLKSVTKKVLLTKENKDA